jgi:hypothetical protein
VEIVAWVSSIGDQEIEKELDLDTVSREDVDKSLVRCPDEEATVKMIEVRPLSLSLPHRVIASSHRARADHRGGKEGQGQHRRR